MATSTRPRRAAAPASAEHPARSDDSAAKKTAAKTAANAPSQNAAAKKAPATKKTPAPDNAVAKPVPAGRQAAAKKAATPAAEPKRTPAAKKAAPKPVAVPEPLAKPVPARKAARVNATAEAPAEKAAEKAPEQAVEQAVEARPARSRKPAAKTPAAKTPASKATAKSAAKKAPTAAKKAPSRRGTPAAAVGEPVAESAAEPLPAQATPLQVEAPVPVQAPAREAAAVPAHSTVVLQDGDHRQLRWIAGSACPEALHAVALSCADDSGFLQLDNDDALPTLLREAAAAGHALQVDPAAWQQLARRRDARQRLFVLEHAYPEGPASAALHDLLRAPLAPFQAEGALFAACAGRALLADERGLGKTVQALAAAVLLHRHAGVERVLIHCSADQRLSWQREAARFLGARAPEWRVVSDEPGGPHAETIDAWKPGLVVIDEPARLARWDRIDAPFALVLCGTPLEDDAALAEALVDYLDRHREGPLARLRSRTTDDTLDDTLQALMLRRRRADVAPQLPARVASERVLAMGPLQRAVHDRAAASARAVLAAWRRTRHLTDAQQWELGSAMQAMREACHRAEPGQPDSPLAEHTLGALDVLTSELLGHAGLQIAVVAPRDADAAQLADRLARAGARCTVVATGAPLPDEAEVVIAIGMPWRTPPADARPRHWIHLVAEQSIDTALYDTRELREGIASTPAEGGHEGFLHGAALQRYLLAAEAALQALPHQPAG